VVTSKWIYKIKNAADGSVEKYKTRSIARCFSQTKRVVYDETLDLVNSIHFYPYYHP
jgi:Cft2 family RNA processing exonuclease